MYIEGTVHSGVVVLDDPHILPEGTKVTVIAERPSTLGERLNKFKGIGQDLPEDLAENHDHYLHGTAKR